MCDLNKPLFSCTLGEFAEAVAMFLKNDNEPETNNIVNEKTYKGVPGLMEIFNCGAYTARKILHSGAIDGAVIHLDARLFVTDKDKALELYKQSKFN